MTLTEGKLAPDFELPSSTGETVKLSDYRGQRVLIYFYPKDMTSSCTQQACDFRDRHEEFKGLNTVILGISIDPMKQHDKFIAKYGLPFILLSDEEHQVAEQYGVWQLKKMYGKEYMGMVRSTFLIDEEGILLKSWSKVRVKGHIEAALEALQQL
ncbi:MULTISPECIES: thioredoxin-dependent thiol peroxidase [Paenibacillus]|uniref:thioredoxin-dependent thiol peroxidase n=1 Tax=Paenibacillus TaxID=44249 RepID=UPI0007BF50E0|nr:MULTISPECIES: thioredoxin-dependent thiol peroxidase [Paenibacillus]MCZ1264014.1 thioredoxin-dependent thiol peroxidase [Paenibacillus tundrae]WDQ34306.1 thioredoxin-dependent thiol peroxidase [Paenibacillus marchantiae]SHN79062.1 peroxiredoxin Q/BCP [Paenibacillus sp. ov031]SLK07583.1 peroxiredoxin Q/BCP [Paenibacillus sp. RU5A]SOC70782.1 peroxiredoxin Q/BCP [Paenibacillus sp. RU26A]